MCSTSDFSLVFVPKHRRIPRATTLPCRRKHNNPVSLVPNQIRVLSVVNEGQLVVRVVVTGQLVVRVGKDGSYAIVITNPISKTGSNIHI